MRRRCCQLTVRWSTTLVVERTSSERRMLQLKMSLVLLVRLARQERELQMLVEWQGLVQWCIRMYQRTVRAHSATTP